MRQKYQPGLFRAAFSSHLVKNVNSVVGQVEGNQAAQGPESALFHLVDVAALQVEVGEVGREGERPPGQHLQVVVPQLELQCNL